MRRHTVELMFLALLAATGYAAGGETYRVIIKFGSVCCGIDMQTEDSISRILSEHAQESGVSLERRRVYWGEEGEFNLCLRLTGLSSDEQEKLTARLRSAIRDPELVKVEENALCKEGW